MGIFLSIRRYILQTIDLSSGIDTEIDSLDDDIVLWTAAGWWEPHLDPDTPAHLTVRWSIATYNFFLALWRGDDIQVATIIYIMFWVNSL